MQHVERSSEYIPVAFGI